MKHETVTVDIGGLFQILDSGFVAKQLQKLPGVHEANVNYASGSATLSFDLELITLTDIETHICEFGCHYGGEILLAHLGTMESTLTVSAHAAAHGKHDRNLPCGVRDDRKCRAAARLLGKQVT